LQHRRNVNRNRQQKKSHRLVKLLSQLGGSSVGTAPFRASPTMHPSATFWWGSLRSTRLTILL
jgi:hypothetical protein